MAYRWRKTPAAGSYSMRAGRFKPLAVAILQMLPYAYCFGLGMLLQQLIGGAK